MSFYKVNDINFSELKFSRTKKTSGRRFILAYYNKKSFGLKIPKLRIPFDSRVNQFGQLEINLSLGRDEELINKLQNLDEEMENFAILNEWFEDGADFTYNPMIRQSGDFPPLLKMKVQNKDGVIKTLFYDEAKKKIDVNDEDDVVSLMKKGTYVQSAIECTGVWFGEDNKFGLCWKAEQIRIMSRPSSTKEEDCFTFCSDSEEEPESNGLLIDDDDE